MLWNSFSQRIRTITFIKNKTKKTHTWLTIVSQNNRLWIDDWWIDLIQSLKESQVKDSQFPSFMFSQKLGFVSGFLATLNVIHFFVCEGDEEQLPHRITQSHSRCINIYKSHRFCAWCRIHLRRFVSGRSTEPVNVCGVFLLALLHQCQFVHRHPEVSLEIK